MLNNMFRFKDAYREVIQNINRNSEMKITDLRFTFGIREHNEKCFLHGEDLR